MILDSGLLFGPPCIQGGPKSIHCKTVEVQYKQTAIVLNRIKVCQ